MADTLSLPTTAFAAPTALCTTTWLAVNGIISLKGQQDAILTLDDDAFYQAPCPTATIPAVSIDASSPENSAGSSSNPQDSGGDADVDNDHSPHFSDFRDPFYASSFPICYALAATTVTAYMLVIMLFITPRSFFDSGVVHLGRRGGFNSSSGGVSIGGRPWLQKLAALTVAVSLTIATADTFKTAQTQYVWGVQNAKVLQNEVMGGTELKAIRIVSDSFLWLAQAQTLIRLFPRQREKIIIKWAAFALISLDVIFSALNSFMYPDKDSVGNSMPKSFAHPIPALSYLFQLSLGVLYAAWVVYYALMKKKYAFYHPLMKNMCLVAFVSLTSILIPVVFFILDISKPDFTGWGDYVRWVGAAAASVVVWEWAERIEALEREEKKDGILGREVFDGDDTLQVTASGISWAQNRNSRKGGSGGVVVRDRQQAPRRGDDDGWHGASAISSRGRGRQHNRDVAGEGDYSHHAHQTSEEQQGRLRGHILRPPIWLTRPMPAMTLANGADTPSAASTVYAVRYQGGSEATTRTPDATIYLQSNVDLSRQASILHTHHMTDDAALPSQAPSSGSRNVHIEIREPRRWMDLEANTAEPNGGRWRAIFHREDDAPSASRSSGLGLRSTTGRRLQAETNKWDVRTRLEEFAVSRAERIRERLRPTTNTENFPVTVIPAPPRRGAALQQVLEEAEVSSLAASAIGRARRSSDGSPCREVSEEAAQPNRQEIPIPPDNPPLWPGVNPRHFMYEDDDGSSYDDSATETSSVVSHEQERGPEPAPEPAPEPEPDTRPDD